MATDLFNRLVGGPDSVYVVMKATELKEAFADFVQTVREVEDERRAYDDEMATVSRAEASRIFNRSYSTLLRWEKDGYLIPVKIGQTPFYKMSDIKAVLNQKFSDNTNG